MYFSLIIPVYNRPDEINELLDSLTKQSYKEPFEVVIVEDGSKVDCKSIVENYPQLTISYFFKENSGPGDSRNYGMQRAKGDYFIILDSDCIIPEDYLKNVSQELEKKFVDCFGGPDAAHESFTKIQKGINYSMTSFFTTGGIRGGTEKLSKFQPRSFNMGISKKAFEVTKGFGRIHPGEDPDLSIRLWQKGFETCLIQSSYVYHKRRIDWNKFFIQVNKFGKVRPILNKWHPTYSKITYWFPSVFILGFLLSLLLIPFIGIIGLLLYATYFLFLFLHASIINSSLVIGTYALIASCIQFYGYGSGFLLSTWKLVVQKLEPEIAFPKLFFKEK